MESETNLPHYFYKRGCPPVKHPDIYWSETFGSWLFCGETVRNYPNRTTGGIIRELGLKLNPRSL